MKKVAALVLALLLTLAGVASAHSGHDEHGSKKSLSVLVNGVEVVSPANHQMGGKAYVDVGAFAGLFGKSFELHEAAKTVIFNGKSIGNVQIREGIATAWIRDLANAVGAVQVSWDANLNQAYVLVLPEGTIQLEKLVVPAMGEHWANPAELPLGPIYGVHEGKLIFLEYMVAKDDFTKGVSHTNIPGMKGLPSPSVVQSDIELVPNGHPGFEVPHFDIHMYFISDEEQHKIATTYFEMKDAKGSKIGFAAIYNLGPQAFLKVSVSGLTPGKHGMHIHNNAISGNDLATAGSHFNPGSKTHGGHLGDLPNLVVDAQGNADLLIPLDGVTLEKGKDNSIAGKSLIIHAMEDDGKTDPSGNSGDRVAGGNIPQ